MTDYDPDFDYVGNVNRLLLSIKLIFDSVDLKQIIVVTVHADALGPFIDPTLYQKQLSKGCMRDIENLSQKLLPVVEYFKENIEPRILELEKINVPN